MPFSVNEAGLALLPLYEALKPICVEAPGASVPFHDRLAAVTAAPDCAQVADQPWVMLWLPGKLNASVQPLIVELPVFAIVTLAVKPALHELGTVYVTVHGPLAGGGALDADGDTLADRLADTLGEIKRTM